MSEYRTFAGWNARGRRVISGEHAQRYLVDPDTKIAYPAFREDQTKENAPESNPTTDWPTVDVETALANRQKRRAPRPTVIIHPDNTIWVGDDALLNRAMRAVGWNWDAGDYLWHHYEQGAAPVQQVVDAMRATQQYIVIDEREVPE